MVHRNCFEVLDRSLNDILFPTEYLPCGGKTVLLGGDFKQILPVIVKGSRKEMNKFATWLLEIGEGKAEVIKMNDDEEYPSWIKIPSNLRVIPREGDIKDITIEIYDNIETSYADPEYLKERAILTATNDVVDLINSRVIIHTI
ncbi:uncharacterized protein LOC119995416 [Tripterygium wilfordii]|uniref:uncharacterized protein LOC119995416 n=1 Tax=Tripterygium wilfordii TaxID=458696 RepID=UPI0018F7F9E5|nr:uncharacterized protein LOC119995416 [Tripterygium wilfordii]